MRLLALSALSLLAVALMAQTPPETITATFTRQAATFGSLQLYATNVCNVGPMNATVQAYRDVWPIAKALNLQIQTPTAIREVERGLQGKNWPK